MNDKANDRRLRLDSTREKTGRRGFLKVLGASLAVGTLDLRSSLSGAAAQAERSAAGRTGLEAEFDGPTVAVLRKAMNVFCPETKDLPGGQKAGVEHYLADLFAKLKKSNPDFYYAKKKLYNDFVDALPEGFSRTTDPPSLSQALEAVKKQNPVAHNAVQIDTITGYFAHPRARGRKHTDRKIWDQLGYRPIFPCSERPDVKKFKMLSEVEEQLMRHLEQPDDRLCKAAKDELKLHPKHMLSLLCKEPS
jgi:hypothetical protein